jgi:two-component system, LuxR family, response regulator FixJ
MRLFSQKRGRGNLIHVIADQNNCVRLFERADLARVPWNEEKALPSKAVGIVEDDDAVRDALKILLASRGIEAKCFASAADFLRSPDLDQFSGLVVDQHMPNMSGIELLELLRSRKLVIPAIMITGASDPHLEGRAKKAGVLAVLHKPFSGSELEGWVRLAFVAARSDIPNGIQFH